MRTILLATCLSFVPTIHAQPLAWNWAWHASGSGSESASVRCSPAGAVHVMGATTATMVMNGALLEATGGMAAFLQQVDPADGTGQWTAIVEHTASIGIIDVGYRSTGELVVAGSVTHNGDAVQFGTHTLPAMAEGTEPFLAGLSSDGTWTWVQGVGGQGSEYPTNVAVDDSDAIMLLSSSGTSAFSMRRFTGQGVQVWETYVYIAFDTVNGYAMDVLPGGDAVVTGRFYGTCQFGTHSVSVGNQYYDAFIARISTEGEWSWVEKCGGPHWDKGFGVRTNAAGEIFAMGTFRNVGTFGPFQLTAGGPNDLWIAKLSGDGTWQWAQAVGSTAYMEVYGFDHAEGGGFVATGSYSFSAPTLGGTTLPEPVSNDIYVAAFDAAGTLVSAVGVGGAGNDQGMSAACDGAGHVYASGTYSGQMTVGGQLFPHAGGGDLLVGRLDPDLGTALTPVLLEGSALELRATDAGPVVLNPKGLRGTVQLSDALGRSVGTLRVAGTDLQRLNVAVALPDVVLWRFTGTDGLIEDGKLVVPRQ